MKVWHCTVLGMQTMLLVFVSSGCGSSEKAACTEGEMRCSEDVLLECRAAKWIVRKNCQASNQLCQASDCVSGPCEEGAKRCSQQVVQVCRQGEFVTDQDCTTSEQECVAGVCVTPPCTSGEVQCLDNVVQRCESGEWLSQTNCEDLGQICEQGACIDEPCEEGQRMCVDQKVQVCKQGVYEIEQDCLADDLRCEAGACVICSQEQKQCQDTRVQVCQEHVWVDETECSDADQVCFEGACVDCIAEQTRCLDDVIQICDGGSWSAATDCASTDQRCFEGECVCIDEQIKCQDSVIQICQDGVFEPTDDCAVTGQVCHQGSCVDCIDGQKKCQGNQTLVCAAGVWGAPSDCGGLVCFQGECYGEVEFPQEPGDAGPCTFRTQEFQLQDGDRNLPLIAYVPEGKAGPFETIVVNHAFLVPATLYASLAEHLASWCYLTVLNDSPVAMSHARYALDIQFVVDWLTGAQTYALDGYVNKRKLGLLGHSVGGKVSLLAELEQPGLVQAMVVLDPVDTLQPSLTPERVDELQVPTLFMGETFSGENGLTLGGMTQYCAPLDQNYQQFFDELDPQLDALEITVFSAMHMSWLDDVNCTACRACVENPQADHDLVKALTKRYMVAWFERYLRGRQELEAYLGGEKMDADVAQGRIGFRKRVQPCQSSERRCYQDVILGCVDGSWVRQEDCAQTNSICSQGSCAE